MKALRQRMPIESYDENMKPVRKKIRFFSCGEYGDKFSRPHYHIALFGYDFPDKEIYFKRSGQTIYRSDTLDKIWGKGMCSIGELNYKTAAYIARYVIKKINGNRAFEHYNEIDKETGEILATRNPEFINMSRKPGIGKDWFESYSDDVFPSDFVVINGREHKVPKYYDKILEIEHPQQFEEIKLKRLKRALADESNNTAERLQTRRKSAELKLRKLKRELETE